jgi:hypothetical protein
MTRKDYVKFAKMFKEQMEILRFEVQRGRTIKSAGAHLILLELARETADIFAEDNPNFNRAKFLAACGMEEIS